MNAPPSAGWQAELHELAERKRIARDMGGAGRVARHHAAGRLTVGERIERRLQRVRSPFRSVEASPEEIIDPRDTRPLPRAFANLAAPLRTSGRSLFTMRP